MTDVPVMAIPENSLIEDLRDIKHVAFFTNLHKRDLLSFDYLVNYLLTYKELKITLVHVVLDSGNKARWTEAQLQGLKDYFNQKYSGLNITYKLIDNMDITPQIKEFIESEDVKIVAINTRRRNLWGRIFIPSSSRKILSSLNVTLLALRGKIFTHF
jgi:hypothetical protein